MCQLNITGYNYFLDHMTRFVPEDKTLRNVCGQILPSVSDLLCASD